VTREDIYREFAIYAEHPINAPLTINDMTKRLNLIVEEVTELVDSVTTLIEEIEEASETTTTSRGEMLKELADVQYTISGFAASFGLDLEVAFQRVHESNLSKFLGGVEYNDDNKVMKGADYQPPNLEDLVK
jgi:predicted HAD superfamily Cof-like phosphohydrolase